MMSEPTVLVAAPRREPRRGGIKSITGDFIRTERLGAASKIHYISDGCVWPSNAPGLCWGASAPGDKTFGGMDVEDGVGSIFGQYVGVECYLGEGHEAEFMARARRQLEFGEAHEIEASFVNWAAGGSAAGSGVGVYNALAALEEYADQHYIGAPVILMSRRNAVLGDEDGVLHGDKQGGIWTINGTPVVSTWLMPDDKIYAIGWPSVYASDIVTAPSRNITQNREQALAERIYAMAVDCQFRAVATITAAVQHEPDPDEPLEMNLGSIPSSPIPDGTDTTIIVQTNVAPQNEVVLWYAVNGGTPVAAGEMTETGSHEFVWNVTGESTTAGDSVEVWAVSEFDGAPVESNRILIEVT